MLMSDEQLTIKRRKMADAEFQAHDYGNIVVAEAGTFHNDGDEMTATVYVNSIDGSSNDTEKTHYTVRFSSETSLKIVDAFARDNSGSDIGVRGNVPGHAKEPSAKKPSPAA